MFEKERKKYRVYAQKYSLKTFFSLQRIECNVVDLFTISHHIKFNVQDTVVH
jgi:hypothetical protein